MKRALALSGFIGLLFGAGIYAGASVLTTLLPILVQGVVGAAIIFAIVLFFSLAEMPMMLFALRQMTRRTNPRRMVIIVFSLYVMFASVYASIFVLLTGQVVWGLALALLCAVRFASGVLIR